MVEHVVEETGQTFHDDMTFFARKTASGFWDFFDCNSTRNCQTDFKTRMEIVETAEGQQLRIENQNIYMVDSNNAALEFVEAR